MSETAISAVEESGDTPSTQTPPSVGAPRTITDEAVEAIIMKTPETTPPGETHWSTRSMATAAGISHTMVGRIWRTF
jgi:hypothetical protein